MSIQNEKRTFSRITFQADVQLQIDSVDEVQSGNLIDISLKGALVKINQHINPPLLGRSCTMTLTLGEAGEKITMQCKIVHHTGTLLGMECIHIDLDSITNLRMLIALNTGSLALLEKELSAMLKKHHLANN